MEQAPTVSRLFHTRIISLMILLISVDVLLLSYAIRVTAEHGASMMIMFGFEVRSMNCFRSMTLWQRIADPDPLLVVHDLGLHGAVHCYKIHSAFLGPAKRSPVGKQVHLYFLLGVGCRYVFAFGRISGGGVCSFFFYS
jgi:hypothetical protein